jgi:DNA polymerase-3 subunit beta
MKLTINAKDLTAALTDVKRYASNKGAIPVLACCKVVADGDAVTLTATDLECAIILNLNAEVTESGTAVVPVASLAAAIKGCKGDLTLEHSGERLTVAGATIPTDCKPESFPELPTFTGEYADMPVKALQTLISRTIACVSSEVSRFTLNGSLFIGSDTGLKMVATDGHRLAMADEPGSFAPFRVLVPLFALPELLRLKASSVRFGADDNHLFFTTAGRTIIARKLTGNFPDYERVIPRDLKPNSLQIDRAVLLPVVERAVNLQKKERQPTLTFNLNGSVHITTGGDTPLDQTLPGEYTGSEIAAGVNPVYLADWLKSAAAPRVELRFGEMKEDKGLWCVRDAIVLNSESGHQCIVMPLRP